MSAIAIIPAKGHSSRIPRKNLRLFHGKPIIAHSIEAARESGLFDKIAVSTDDAEVEHAAMYFGADYVIHRPFELTKDDVGTQEVMREALGRLAHYHHEYACCIYATAPLIDVRDLRWGFEEVSKGAWFAMSMGMNPPKDAGQFYWGASTNFINGIQLVSPRTAMIPIADERVCDINTLDDWSRAESMYTALRA